MSAAAEQPVLCAEVRRAAVEWLLALQDEGAGADTRERWRRWLEASPAHRQAWRHVEAFGGRLQSVSSPLAHAALAPAGSMSRRRAVKALAVLLFAGAAVGVVEQRGLRRQWLADHRTGVGERAAFTLADGSRVALNAGTALDTRFTGSERLLRLLRGEILVVTARDAAARPFIVETAQGRIEALGTRFSVRQLDGLANGESAVAVFEGAVALRPRAGGEELLLAGERCGFTRHGIGAKVAAAESATAWSQGMIVARDMPLGEFLAELSRHRPGHLGWDEAVAGLRVSGTYPLADTDGVLDMLQASLPVSVRRRTRWWVTLVPGAQA